MIDMLLINEAIVPVPSVLNLTDYELKSCNLLIHTERGFNYRFVDQKHVIHVDEKWFYLEKSKSKIRMFPCDDRPDSDETRHKSNMLKMIFLSAVDVPQRVFFEGEEIV